MLAPMTTPLRISGLGVALACACALLWIGCESGHDGPFREVSPDDCVACHLGEYQTTSQPPHAALASLGYRAERCPLCHDNKNWRPPKDPGLHPDEAFSITTPPHGDFGCADCHDPELDVASAAGFNTDCVGCHTGSHTLEYMDEVHKDDPDYPITGDHSNPNFCLECHPNGRFEE